MTPTMFKFSVSSAAFTFLLSESSLKSSQSLFNVLAWPSGDTEAVFQSSRAEEGGEVV